MLEWFLDLLVAGEIPKFAIGIGYLVILMGVGYLVKYIFIFIHCVFGEIKRLHRLYRALQLYDSHHCEQLERLIKDRHNFAKCNEVQDLHQRMKYIEGFFKYKEYNSKNFSQTREQPWIKDFKEAGGLLDDIQYKNN